MNSSGRITTSDPTRVQDALALDHCLGLDRDAMAAGELHAHRRLRLVVVVAHPAAAVAATEAAIVVQTVVERPRKTRRRTADAFGRAITSRLRPSGVT
jgi:hypothetical protein